MPKATTETVFLLPERRRFAGQLLSGDVAAHLGRADHLDAVPAGEREQLLRYFDVLPRGWPMAAITRQFECGDVLQHAWLRADPVHVRPDMGGARLLAWGNLQLTAIEAKSLVEMLMPVFGDAGFPISSPAPERWYLQLPREAKLPTFSAPADSLGEDLLKHLPEGPEGRRWRALLNEAQVLLHNHPLNASRIARGLLPVNSLWFWGAGALPTVVRSAVRQIETDDFELRSLAALVDGTGEEKSAGLQLLDFRSERQWPAVQAAMAKAGATFILDFADGSRWRIAAGQRWRFWRRPLKSLA